MKDVKRVRPGCYESQDGFIQRSASIYNNKWIWMAYSKSNAFKTREFTTLKQARLYLKTMEAK